MFNDSMNCAQIAKSSERYLICNGMKYRSLATIVSQPKICDFSRETFKGFVVL